MSMSMHQCPCPRIHFNFMCLCPWVMSMDHLHGSCPWAMSISNVHGSSPWVMPKGNVHGSVLSICQAKFVVKLTVYNLQKMVTFHVYTWERHAFPQYIMRKVLTFCSIINGKFPLFHEYLTKIWKYFVCLSWTYWVLIHEKPKPKILCYSPFEYRFWLCNIMRRLYFDSEVNRNAIFF